MRNAEGEMVSSLIIHSESIGRFQAEVMKFGFLSQQRLHCFGLDSKLPFFSKFHETYDSFHSSRAQDHRNKIGLDSSPGPMKTERVTLNTTRITATASTILVLMSPHSVEHPRHSFRVGRRRPLTCVHAMLHSFHRRLPV